MSQFDVNEILLDDLVKTRRTDRPRHLLYVSDTASIEFAIEFMTNHKITCCGIVSSSPRVVDSDSPLFVDGQEFLGIVTVNDFTKLLQGENEDDIYDIVRSPAVRAMGKTEDSTYLFMEPRYRSIVNVCRELGNGVHHALIIDDSPADTKSPEMLSQSDLVRFILHLESSYSSHNSSALTGSALKPRLSQFFNTPVSAIGTQTVECLFLDTPMTVAVPLLCKTRCMPVCDHKTKRIVSIISSTDLLGMDALLLSKRDGITTGDFLLRRNIHGYHDPILVTPADDIRYAVTKMMNRHVHCIFIEEDRYESGVRESWRWIGGVLSMSDIIREFNKQIFSEWYFGQMTGNRK